MDLPYLWEAVQKLISRSVLDLLALGNKVPQSLKKQVNQDPEARVNLEPIVTP